MPRPTRTDIDPGMLQSLLSSGPGATPSAQKLELIQTMRAGSPQRSLALDQILLEHIDRYAASLGQAAAAQQELSGMIDNLTAPPWHPALFLAAVETDRGRRALVLHGGRRLLVGTADGLSLDSLAVGDELFLSHELNVIVASAPYRLSPWGETASFEHATGDGRCVLRWRDDEVVVNVGAGLSLEHLQPGDRIRWDRAAWLALEKLERDADRRYVASPPDVTREQVGGLDGIVEELCNALTAALVDPVRAAVYRVTSKQGILIVGPPGVGKTLMARVAAAEITRLHGQACYFAVVKPGEWLSPYLGESEERLRATFRALRNAATNGPAVLFLDEVESISRTRGAAGSHHHDRILAALLAELDGFSPRDGVAVIAASNRKDLIDPAILDRLADVEITVPRPNMRAASAIFGIHLPPCLPFRDGDSGRAAIIDGAVSRLYSPNAEGNELCRLHFRSGAARAVSARDLASGRLFAQITSAIRRSALIRDLQGGDPGLCFADMERAVNDALARLRSTLTPRNAHAHLPDLPQDNDVVRIEPTVSRVPRPDRFRSAA